ncbi:DUF2306 domain-containing protein [Tenggerimyces flavus]|uniref:DUF2306 domain-containing protein n=1 Tax=Tenggerimyces flavus TaxID=1708749 RepID=A0ABV7Y9E9_9ACTN|nr:DUF2306 domain-containing protein [Tenggerimyces flavus]MBM7786635.1 uncharacterized membrane protein YozB (DUF420 family) [Tenggerimyces flavus]
MVTPPTAPPPATVGRAKLSIVQAITLILILIVLTFAVLRMIEDLPHLQAGTVPDDDEYAKRYVEHPWLAVAHIAPGVLYLIGAPFQLAHRIRSKAYWFHRRFGRLLLVAGLLSAIFAIAFGIPYAFGGVGESVAAVVFSLWMIACLVLAFRAIKQDRVADHRRWMIRAFAIALGVGSIRIWIAIFSSTGLLDFQGSFAPAFWVAFVSHVIGAELWIRTTPQPQG